MKNIIIGVVVIVIIVLFVMSANNNSNQNNSENEMNNDEQSMQSELSGTFAEIFAMGKSVKCTFEDTQENSQSTGIVYMTDNGEKIRADFTINSEGMEEQRGYMIRVDDTNYIWGSFGEQGIKAEVTEEEREYLFAPDTQDSVDIDPNVNYKCENWIVDNSKFDVPSDISFVDLNALMSGGNIDMDELKSLQCAACQNISNLDQRSQCLQALGC